MSQKPVKTIATMDASALQAGVDRMSRSIRELKAFDFSNISERGDARLDVIHRKVNAALADMLGMASPDFKAYVAPRLDSALDNTFGAHYSPEEFHQTLQEGIDKGVKNLTAARDAMAARLEAAADKPPAPAPAPPPAAAKPTLTLAPTPASTPGPATMKSTVPSSTSKCVLVLGPDGDIAVEFLARLGLEPAVLDAPTLGALDAMRDIGFAVVLPAAGDGLPAQMLAIGYLLAALGRSRIALLAPAGQDLPAALEGATRISPDEAGMWELMLAREMKRAGLDIDLNKAI